MPVAALVSGREVAEPDDLGLGHGRIRPSLAGGHACPREIQVVGPRRTGVALLAGIVGDALMLRVPVFGLLLRKVAVSKFTRTMGTMLSSGVAILEALDIVAKTSGNKTIENAIYNVRTAIAEGQTMADPLSASGVFPPMVCQMIAVGEATGALDAMLGKIADFYDEEVDQAVENLTSMIEPFMMVFLGTVIGALVVAMYLPVFKMAGAL